MERCKHAAEPKVGYGEENKFVALCSCETNKKKVGHLVTLKYCTSSGCKFYKKE